MVDAYWAGLERRLGAGHSLQGVASVASFFISRIDSLADGLLDRQSADSPQRGTAALTAAAMAYSHFLELHGNTRWQELAAAGAQHQRLLWASTSTKDPRYSELKYIEALIVGDTINTMPLETLEAYREHGEPALRLDQALDRSTQWNQKLVEQGIILEALAVQLEREGIEKFIDPYDRLLEELEHKRLQVLGRSA